MRVVISAWHLRDTNVGIGIYCKNLIEAISKIDKENQYEILTGGPYIPRINQENIKFTKISFPIFKRRFWEQASSFLIKGYDILHMPYDSLVLFKKGRLAVTIHDVKPLLFREGSNKLNISKIYDYLVLRKRIEKIDRVITVSNNSKNDIMKWLKIPGEKIDVIYNGVSEEYFNAPKDTRTLKMFNIDKRYILYIGGGDKTKNIHSLILAYKQLPVNIRNEYYLVLAGDLIGLNYINRLIEENRLKNNVIFTGVLYNTDLIQIYKNASLFIFPSLYEGFGLPVLEAMAAGVPVIASNISSIPEIIGDAGIMIDPYDINGLTNAIEKVITDKILQQSLITKGIERAKMFRWEDTALKTIESYNKALKDN